MPPFTTNQWIVLGLVLVLGWLLGLLSRGGGAKRWKREFEEQQHERIALEKRLATADARIEELERQAFPVDARSAASIAAAARGERDDLALINGVGRNGEMRLNALGVHSYGDLIKMDGDEVHELEERLGMPSHTIESEHWREQAELLQHGQIAEKERLYG